MTTTSTPTSPRWHSAIVIIAVFVLLWQEQSSLAAAASAGASGGAVESKANPTPALPSSPFTTTQSQQQQMQQQSAASTKGSTITNTNTSTSNNNHTTTAKDIMPVAAVAAQIEGKMSHASRLGISALPEDDGRSAYLSSQYGVVNANAAGGAGDAVTPPPLYQLLQQQMEQVLAATGNDFKAFPMQAYTKKYKLKDAPEMVVAQVPPKKPLFTFHSEESDDYADETEAETDVDADSDDVGGGGGGGIGGGYGMTPIHIPSVRPKPTPTPTRRTVVAPPSSSSSSSNANGGQSKTTITTNAPTMAHKVAADMPLPVKTPLHGAHSNANTHINSNNNNNSTSSTGTLHNKQKRRITFKTVSTSSQFVSTPLADIMLKFSIGIAKPTSLQEAGATSNSSDIETTIGTHATEMARNVDTPPRQPSVVKHKQQHVKNRRPKLVNV